VSFVIDECHAGHRPRRLRNRNCHRDRDRPLGGGPGSYRIVDENGTVVAGHWANADGVNALLGAAAAWGIVVGTLNVLMTMFKRTKRNKLLNQIRTAPDPQHAVAILKHQFETEVLDVVPPAERPTFYGTIVEHVSQSAAARHPISTQAIVGGVLIFVLRIVSTLPRRSRSCSWTTRRPQSSGRASSRSRCCSSSDTSGRE
jgi:hypothetical protein